METIKTSSFQKNNTKYMLARHYSPLGLPDDYSIMRQLIASFLGDKEYIEILEKELTELEKAQRNFFGDEEYEKLKSKGLVYTKELIFNSIRFFDREYYKTDFVTSKIKELDEKYLAKEHTLDRKSFSPVIKAELQNIIKELNLNMPVINDCLNIAFICIIKHTDLLHIDVPREIVTSPTKFRFDDKERDRRVQNIDKYL